MLTKRRMFFALALCILVFSCSQKQEEVPQKETAGDASQEESAVMEDSAFLPETPAPETESYYFGLIRKGPVWSPEETPEIAQLQEDHLAHIKHMADSGVLALAGPFGDDPGTQDIRGLFIFEVDSLARARRLADADPMVQAKRLKVDIAYLETPEITYDELYALHEYYLCFVFQSSNFGVFGTPDFWALAAQQDSMATQHGDSCRVVLAGYFADERNALKLYGMIIYEADSYPLIRRVTSTIPGLSARMFVTQLYKWYGPSGLVGYRGT